MSFRKIIELERIKDGLSDWYSDVTGMDIFELYEYEKEELNNIFGVLSELITDLYARLRLKRENEKLHEVTMGGGTSNE